MVRGSVTAEVTRPVMQDARMGFDLDRGQADRLSGAVWGHLIGDAVGVPYEFGTPVAAESVVFGRAGAHGQPPGTWSDDGAMMLGLLDSLLTVGFDPADQGMRYLAWTDDGAYTPEGDGKFDIGNATAEALDRIRRGVPAGEAGGDETTLGNGSLMRTLPIALVGYDLDAAGLVEHASLASAVTHASLAARTTSPSACPETTGSRCSAIPSRICTSRPTRRPSAPSWATSSPGSKPARPSPSPVVVGSAAPGPPSPVSWSWPVWGRTMPSP